MNYMLLWWISITEVTEKNMNMQQNGSKYSTKVLQVLSIS